MTDIKARPGLFFHPNVIPGGDTWHYNLQIGPIRVNFTEKWGGRMAYEIWQPVNVAMCDRIGEEVEIQARLVYPADILPDQPPRILAKRCNHGIECNLLDRPSCDWAGTLPGFDPLNH